MIQIKSLLYRVYKDSRKTWVRISLRLLKTDTIFTDSKKQKYFIEKNNALDHFISKEGLLDGGLPFKILNLCDRGSIAIDVGANAGYYTLPFAKWFSKVHAFEPVKEIAKKLEKNIILNSFSNVEIHVAACGQEDGCAELYVQDSVDGDFKLNSGLSSLVKRQDYFKTQINVPLVSIDSIFSGSHIGIIKIDVEGAEYQVLKGSTKVIRESSPVIVWEASVNICRSNILSCLNLLEELNYTSYLINSTQEITSLHSTDIDELDFDSNVISISNESPNLSNLKNILME